MAEESRGPGGAHDHRVETAPAAPLAHPGHPVYDFKLAGERYRSFAPREQDELVKSLVDTLAHCTPDIQARMVSYFVAADRDYGRRVAEGLGVQARAAAD